MAGVVGAEILQQRYGPDALRVFDAAERARFLHPDGTPRDPSRVVWELLYRLEPELYARLVAGETLHPGVIAWLPRDLGHVAEIGAGHGRLTLPLARRCARLTAIEPAAPLLSLLQSRLQADRIDNVRTQRGFFDEIPVATGSCDMVISCSAFAPESEADPERCLAEMRRCCMPGGLIVIVWPNAVGWLQARGFRHEVFPGDMAVDFASPEEAVAMCRIFYPHAVEAVRGRGSRRVAYEILDMQPPRDLCWLRCADHSGTGVDAGP